MKSIKIVLFYIFALCLATIGANIISPLIDIKPIYIGAVLFATNFIPITAGSLNQFIFTAPGGAATAFTFNLTYLPQRLKWNDAAAPLTSLRVSTKEDGVLHDLNAASIAAMNGFLCVGAQAANDVKIQLADGQLDRTVTISGVTSAAGAINFYENSQRKGANPLKTQIDTALALTPSTFKNFFALFIPAMATGTDYADITYTNGFTCRYEMQDLQSLSSFFQQVEGIIINNLKSNIEKVVLRCAAATPVYSLRLFINGQ